MEEEVLLVDLKKGQRGIVKRIDANSELKQRLLSFGIVRGSEIEVVDYGINRSTIEVRVGNTLLALRYDEAKAIEVERIDGED
ncbi:MAG: ferrous iron transport protein A [Epsilonproteobacteria bacterium]|nr:ferrous iron transport protein A [Campylobacterota bacterium]